MDLYTIRILLGQGKSIYDLPLNVTFYARVSTDREEQLNSLENQVMYFEKFIKEQPSWTFVAGYIDEGITGTSVSKRDQFLKMIEDAKNGKFNLILTKEISRFSRNTLDSIKYTQELLSYNVGIHFLSDNMNTFQSDSELRLTIMSSIAQEEIRKLSERVRFGYKRSIEKGIVAGSNNILGYTKNKGKLVIEQKEAETVKLIFQTYVTENIGLTKVGIKLFEEYGIKNKKGNPYSGRVLARQIKNPKYKGYYCANKETTLDYHNRKRKRFKESEWIVYKDNIACPPIVSEELWEEANRKLKANANKHKCLEYNNEHTHLPFSGIMHCYQDGATFVRAAYRARKKDGIRRKYWACSIHRKYGIKKENGCHSAVIYYEELVNICKKITLAILNSNDNLLKEIKDTMDEIQLGKSKIGEIEKIRKNLEYKKKEKIELISMRVRKEIDTEEYNEFKNNINKEIIRLENKLKIYIEWIEKQQDTSTSFISFKKKVNNLIWNTDDKILKFIEPLFQNILVESIKDSNDTNKAILHGKLNILDSYERTLDFKNFLLLF